MDLASILVMLIIGAHIILFVLVFISLITSSKASPEIMADGKKLIRPSKVLLWSGILLAIWAMLGLYIAAEALLMGAGIGSGILMAMILLITAGPFAYWILRRYLRFRIIWDDKAVTVVNWRNKITTYNWSDLVRVEQRTPANTLREPIYHGAPLVKIYDVEIHFKNQGIVRAAPNLLGYQDFVADAQKHRDVQGGKPA